MKQTAKRCARSSHGREVKLRSVSGRKRTIQDGKARPQRGSIVGLRALTVCCPEIGAAILSKQKRVENRSWPCPKGLISKWFALHIGGGSTPEWIRRHVARAWDVDKAPKRWRSWDPVDRTSNKLPPSRSIIGMVRVRGEHRVTRREKASNPWALGPFAWEIDRVVPVEPPICDVSGALGFWKVRKQVSARQMARLNKVFALARNKKNLGMIKANT